MIEEATYFNEWFKTHIDKMVLYITLFGKCVISIDEEGNLTIQEPFLDGIIEENLV